MIALSCIKSMILYLYLPVLWYYYPSPFLYRMLPTSITIPPSSQKSICIFEGLPRSLVSPPLLKRESHIAKSLFRIILNYLYFLWLVSNHFAWLVSYHRNCFTFCCSIQKIFHIRKLFTIFFSQFPVVYCAYKKNLIYPNFITTIFNYLAYLESF